MRPLVDNLVIDEAEYEDLFGRTEALMALIELDWQEHAASLPDYRKGRSSWLGRHVNRERHRMVKQGLVHDLMGEVESNRNDWWPLQGKLFGADWQRAATAIRAYEENVQSARQRRW
ncbi:MAG: hypothetical protein M3P96_16085 [Actinomycetota bacterium]|nr:hypothetical protein [Actinomycetota bacterium]